MRRLLLWAFLGTVALALAGCGSAPQTMPTPLPTSTLAPLPTPAAPPPAIPARLVPTVTPIPPRPTPAPAGWKPEFTGGPRLLVGKESVDAGTLVYDQPVLAGFQLVNVGDAPLVMKIPLAARLVAGC